jgi:hypothetical protein
MIGWSPRQLHVYIKLNRHILCSAHLRGSYFSGKLVQPSKAAAAAWRCQAAWPTFASMQWWNLHASVDHMYDYKVDVSDAHM